MRRHDPFRLLAPPFEIPPRLEDVLRRPRLKDSGVINDRADHASLCDAPGGEGFNHSLH